MSINSQDVHNQAINYSHNPVKVWFGDAFSKLHPQLQGLHEHGGQLSGRVNIVFAQGVAGWLGRRIGKKFGLPLMPQRDAECDFQVDISHDQGLLIWQRRFSWLNQQGAQTIKQMTSVFKPVGQHPTGYWLESTGNFAMRLGVNIHDGGWHWQQRAVCIGGVSMPSWLLPRTLAYKTVVDGRYRFCVAVSWLWFGELFRYQGDLNLMVS